MSPLRTNALWGLKYGALFALAFALGLGVAIVVQGSSAFAAYHPSSLEILAGVFGTWIVGGLVVGVTRPLVRSSLGYLIVAMIGGAFVAAAALIIVFGFSYFSVGTTLLAGTAFGLRVWMLRNASQSAV